MAGKRKPDAERTRAECAAAFDLVMQAVAQGASVKNALAKHAPDLKSVTFRAFVYARPEFNERMQQALADRAISTAGRKWRTIKPSDSRQRCDRHREEILRRYRSGESLREICASKPEYPNYAAFKKDMEKRHATEWAGAVGAFREARRLAAFEDIPEVEAGRFRLRANERRRCEEHWDAILVRHRAGEKLHEIFSEGRSAGYPSHASFNAYVRLDRDRAKLVENAHLAFWRSAYPNAAAPRRVLPAGQLNKLLSEDAIYAEAERVVPRKLEPHIRDDFKSDLVVMVLDGEIGIHEMASWASQLRKSNVKHQFTYSLDVKTNASLKSGDYAVDGITTDTMVWGV